MQKLISYDEIKAFEPCYDPNKFIPNDWLGTVIDILKMADVPAKDRLWVCVRHQFLTDRQLHLYALACARQVENNSQDPRVKECNNVMEAFLKGEATKEQLSSASTAAARSGVSSESGTAAAYAANSAASAAYAAFIASAVYTAYAAKSAVWSAAMSGASAYAAEEQQCEMLIKIIQENP